MPMTDNEWGVLLTAVRQEIERIQARCGFGEVSIEIANGSKIRVLSRQSLDFQRDILARGCLLEERIPEAVTP